MLYLACDDRQVKDDFVRELIAFTAGPSPVLAGGKEPQTVDYMRVRMQGRRAGQGRRAVPADRGKKANKVALQAFDAAMDSDLLYNVDVKSLFEGELMVGLSEFEPLTAQFRFPHCRTL